MRLRNMHGGGWGVQRGLSPASRVAGHARWRPSADPRRLPALQVFAHRSTARDCTSRAEVLRRRLAEVGIRPPHHRWHDLHLVTRPGTSEMRSSASGRECADLTTTYERELTVNEPLALKNQQPSTPGHYITRCRLREEIHLSSSTSFDRDRIVHVLTTVR